MELIRLDDAPTKALFETMFRQRSLVPVLGAGFSKGAATEHAHVPDASEFARTMLKCLQANVGPDAASLSDRGFAEIAEYFLNPDFVPAADAKELIRRHFIGVKLDETRRSFLRSQWPYIYTLNIDDAIESNSAFKNKVVPNRPISETAKTLPCVYKVHGDAADELLYDEPSKIIFSTGQYVRSLTTNASMLNALKTDLVEQNTLFVGCSLSNEIDLLFALAEYHDPFPEGRRSIFVTQSDPNRFEMAKLGAHGINTVLIVPDYDTFYVQVARWAGQVVPTADSLTGSLHLGAANMRRLGLERSLNLSFLLREPAARNGSHEITLPGYHIRRDIEDTIVRASAESPLSLIRGRRFSGRTLLLRSIAFTVKAKELFFIDSNTRISQEVLDQLIESENSLIIFDTNSLTADTATSLARGLEKLRSKRSAAIVAVNRTEPDIVGALVRHVDDRADFELDARLSPNECADLNRRLDAIGLLRFNCRRTLLDNTFVVLQQTPNGLSELTKAHDLNEREIELLLVVAIADKAYSSLATALDLRTAELFSISEKLAPIIEIVDTTKGELRDMHSRHKIIANSRTGLAIQIRKVIDSRGYQWVAERFAALVNRLIGLPQFTAVGHSMFMFDAVNHVMSQGVDRGEGTGYRPVVRSLYEKLQPTLSGSPDYWLQRAKAVFNIEDDQTRILEGITFAMKAFHEAERERTIDNAEFLIALLYGKLCSTTRHERVDHVVAAVKWFSQAIRNYERNVNYVQAMLDRSQRRKSYFDQLCDYLEGPISDTALLPLKRDVDFLISVRRSWKALAPRIT
jgi:hypothetical protein